MRNPRLAPRLQLQFISRMAGMKLDPSHDFFTVFGVGDAHNLHVCHGWMGEKELFQLAWVNILTTANDHVLVAPHNPHIALLIHLRQVPGVHPAFAVDGICGGLRVVPVTEHHAVATGTQLANLTPRDGIACGIDQLALQLWLGTPYRGNTQFQFIRRTCLD